MQVSHIAGRRREGQAIMVGPPMIILIHLQKTLQTMAIGLMHRRRLSEVKRDATTSQWGGWGAEGGVGDLVLPCQDPHVCHLHFS